MSGELFPSIEPSTDPSARLQAARTRLTVALLAEEWMEMNGGPEHQAEADAVQKEIDEARNELAAAEAEALARLKL